MLSSLLSSYVVHQHFAAILLSATFILQFGTMSSFCMAYFVSIINGMPKNTFGNALQFVTGNLLDSLSLQICMFFPLSSRSCLLSSIGNQLRHRKLTQCHAFVDRPPLPGYCKRVGGMVKSCHTTYGGYF